MKISVIDIGSNTIRLYIYNYKNKKIESIIRKNSNVGLVSYIENGHMSQKGIQKAIRFTSSYIEISEYFGVEKIFIFATAAIRKSKNNKEIIKYMEKSLGHKIDLLSGEEEAFLGYIGVSIDHRIKDGIIIDIGGGSTEYTIIENKKVHKSNSLNLGSLSLFDKFSSNILLTKEESRELSLYIDKKINKAINIKKEYSYSSFVGGSSRATANIIQEYYNKNDNNHMTIVEIKKIYNLILEKDKKIIDIILKVSPDRIHTIMPGILIIISISNFFGVKDIYVSEKGVREGYLLGKICKK